MEFSSNSSLQTSSHPCSAAAGTGSGVAMGVEVGTRVAVGSSVGTAVGISVGKGVGSGGLNDWQPASNIAIGMKKYSRGIFMIINLAK